MSIYIHTHIHIFVCVHLYLCIIIFTDIYSYLPSYLYVYIYINIHFQIKYFSSSRKGCSLDGAVKLNHGLTDIAVNWSGMYVRATYDI